MAFRECRDWRWWLMPFMTGNMVFAEAEDIINRVGFHNIGKNQTQGLIVMSIDDGADLADVDANYDAMVVIVNGSENEQTHTIASASVAKPRRMT